MSLRGFDSFSISLGDEMRGERASLGKSMSDAERDMRIKAPIIQAIENCNLGGFPNQSVIAGYVRSYARYLGMDADKCFARFCAESGYVSPATMRQNAAEAQRAGEPTMRGATISDPISQSRFGPAPPARSFVPRVSVGAITSTLALIGLIGGLGYGGYALLQEIQRVGFAPLPEAPSVVADAPVIASSAADQDMLSRPTAEDYAGGGALAALVVPTELPATELADRDGPISAIDPANAGVFDLVGEPRETQQEVAVRVDQPIVPHVPGHTVPEARDTNQQTAIQHDGVMLVAAEDAWVRIRGDGGAILYEGILGAGERYDLPTRLVEPVLRAGNAGGIFVVVDGVTYGPVGERGRVVSGVSLRAGDVRSSMPQAAPEEVVAPVSTETEQRAEAAQIPNNR